MSSEAERRRTFHTLDGLRGVAALAVVFRHLPPNPFAAWTAGSYRAVDLFFVLSGFVLAHAYGERLTSSLSPGRFMIERLIRLYPLYLLGLVLGIGVVAAQIATGAHVPWVGGRVIVLGLLFVPHLDWAKSNVFPLDYPAWSLFFELVINVVFAVLAARLGTRLLGAVLAAGAVLLVVTAVSFGSLNVGFDMGTLWGGFGRVGFTFFAGVAMHRVWAAGRWPWLALPAWAAVLLTLALFAVTPPPAWLAAYDAVAALVIMPALVLAASRREPPPALAGGFAVLGVASYAVYILQVPLVRWLEFGRETPIGAFVAILWVGVVVGAALLADRFYDAPVRSRLRRLLTPRRAVPATPEPLVLS